MSFIVRKALKAQFQRMRGALATLATGCVLFGALLAPDAAFARENDSDDAATCTDPRHRHVVVRTLTEPAPIRKKEKVRVRRILM